MCFKRALAVYTPGHGKYVVDGFNTVQKRYLATCLRMPGTPEKDKIEVHQPNDMVQEFHLHLFDSKLQNAATNIAYLYTLLARMFEKKRDKRWNNVGSNI